MCHISLAPCVSCCVADLCHKSSDNCNCDRYQLLAVYSALKYIKNYLRSIMGKKRLNGLAHMYINRDIELANESVIEEFGRKNRRLKYI